MAYAALISLAQTIDRLLNPSHISILPHPLRLMGVFQYHELEPLQKVLESLDSSRIRNERLDNLDGAIREELYKIEDVIETLVSDQLLSRQPEDGPPFSISIDLEELKQYFVSFRETMEKMKEEYIEELSPMPQKVNDDAADPSTPESGGERSKMVGLSAQFSRIKYDLIERYFTQEYSIEKCVAISGMAGIGKSTLAREIFEDPEIVDHFDSHAWVKVGPTYQLQEILSSILSQVYPEVYKMFTEEGDEKLEWYLEKSLNRKRSLIVLDDIWEEDVYYNVKAFLPYDDNGSRILVISTMKNVAYRCSQHRSSYEIPFLNKEESWDLLREKVFGDQQESCPRELEKAGKKIAEKCDGLPLLIVTVARILSKAKKTVEYWNEVAEKKNSVFTDAYDQVSEVLLPSYNYLPQDLKPCFLYMGILPQDYEISRSKLINLWESEGFIALNDRQTFEQITKRCLEQLVSRSVVIVRQKVSALPLMTKYNTEKYHLHSTFLYLCVREARKNKFYHVLNRYAEDAVQSMKGQRRLCIQNKVLFAIKDMYNSMLSVSATRSLLCTGPYHQYPVPVCSGLRLLRVLDSMTIRFYEFPVEVLELTQLRYLSMTYDGELPASISRLWILECLIVDRHIHLKSFGAPSYLPMEIWDMKELKHLQVKGSDLPDPCETSILSNLLTLLDVSTHSCTQRILERIPNLQSLGIRTGWTTGAAGRMSYFDHILYLDGIKTLTLIMDPVFMSEVVASPLYLPPTLPPSIIDSNLRKLSLSGLGCPWEDMRLIASLPNLEVLKLRCDAYRGPKCETPDGFKNLTYLLIEDSDLVVWTLGKGSCWFLKRLSLKNCYQLEEIPRELKRSLEKIEVIDCNPSAVSWAKQMKDVYDVDDVYVESSWE